MEVVGIRSKSDGETLKLGLAITAAHCEKSEILLTVLGSSVLCGPQDRPHSSQIWPSRGGKGGKGG